MTYSANTANDSFESNNAKEVASVAVNWKRRGMDVKAYSTAIVGDKIDSVDVPVTTVRETAKALSSAHS